MKITEQQFFEILDEQKFLEDNIPVLLQIINHNINNYDGIFDLIYSLFQDLPEFQQKRLKSKINIE